MLKANPAGQFQPFCYGQAVPAISHAIPQARAARRTLRDWLIQKLIKSKLVKDSQFHNP